MKRGEIEMDENKRRKEKKLLRNSPEELKKRNIKKTIVSDWDAKKLELNIKYL